MELILPRLPSMLGLNWMFWSQACTPSQNQKTAYVLVSQFLKLLRPLYNSLVLHHQRVHWKSPLWQYTTTYICQINGTEGKEKESDTDLCNVLGSSSYSVHCFKTKPVFPYTYCRALTAVLGQPRLWCSPLSARKLNYWMETEQNMASQKNCDQKYLLPFFRQNTKMSWSYFFPSLFSPFLGLFWWCSLFWLPPCKLNTPASKHKAELIPTRLGLTMVLTVKNKLLGWSYMSSSELLVSAWVWSTGLFFRKPLWLMFRTQTDYGLSHLGS